MPLTSKGKEILSNMEKTYKSPEKAKEVFYASANKGTIKGVHNDRRDTMSEDAPSLPNPFEEVKGSKKPIATKPAKPMPNPFGKSKDQTEPDPASGPMSTKGPSAGESKGIPEAATPSSHPAKANDCAMSLDAIKEMGKRIGRY